MKPFLYSAFALLVCVAAQCQQVLPVTRINFTTLTRGYQKQLFLSPDSVIEIIDGRQEENKVTKRAIDKTEWELLINALGSVRPQTLPEMQSPTSRRAFDGARHSTITLYDKNGKEWQHTFDDEVPHQDLKPLMDAIQKVQASAQR